MGCYLHCTTLCISAYSHSELLTITAENIGHLSICLINVQKGDIMKSVVDL